MMMNDYEMKHQDNDVPAYDLRACHVLGLNIEKCKLMSFTRKRTTLNRTYLLGEVNISRTSSGKYLGIHLTSYISWTTHVNIVTGNATRTLGYLKRNLKNVPLYFRKLPDETLRAT